MNTYTFDEFLGDWLNGQKEQAFEFAIETKWSTRDWFLFAVHLERSNVDQYTINSIGQRMCFYETLTP